MSILQGVIAWFTLIPDVVWAAVIASGLTFLGVTLSNRANRKCLLLQLNHATKEKDKEREMQLRREVYIGGAEAIAEAIKDIQLLPNRIIFSDNLEMCNRLLPALAKIHMVGTFETIKNTTEWMEKFNQSTLPIVPEIAKFAILKQELANLKNLSESQINTMKEINKNFEQMDSSSKQNPSVLDIYKKTFEQMKTEHDSTVTQWIGKETQLKDLHAKLLSMCLQTGNYLQKEALHVILSIRKELNLEIDTDEYISAMNKTFKLFGDTFNPDNIKKMIYGGP